MAEAENIQAIATEISKAKRQKVIDPYYFLLRVGDDFSSYSFNWEPFRDLAGPLKWHSADSDTSLEDDRLEMISGPRLSSAEGDRKSSEN